MELKDVCAKEHCPFSVAEIGLKHKGMLLMDDEMTLEECNIMNGSIIHLSQEPLQQNQVKYEDMPGVHDPINKKMEAIRDDNCLGSDDMPEPEEENPDLIQEDGPH